MDELRRVAIEEGFADIATRARVWPLLLNSVEQQHATAMPKSKPETKSEFESETEPAPHRFAAVVDRDVERSMFHFDITRALTDAQRERRRRQLKRVINRLFVTHRDELSYIQGFHDICSVVLLVIDDEDKVFEFCEKLSFLYIRDSLRPQLDTLVRALELIFPLIAHADPELHEFLMASQVQTVFTLSWVLTWFSHNLEKFDDVCRIFDFLLASHASMPVYLAVSFILSARDQLLHLECEYTEVHRFFQSLSKVSARPEFSVAPLIRTAFELFQKYPPHYMYKRESLAFPKDSPMARRSLGEIAAERKRRQSLHAIVIFFVAVPVIAAVSVSLLLRCIRK